MLRVSIAAYIKGKEILVKLFSEAKEILIERARDLLERALALPENLLRLRIFWPVMIASLAINVYLAHGPGRAAALIGIPVTLIGLCLIADFWGPKAAKIRRFREDVTEAEKPERERIERKKVTDRQKEFPKTCEGCDDQLARAAFTLDMQVEDILSRLEDESSDEQEKKELLDKLAGKTDSNEDDDEENGPAVGDKGIDDYCLKKIEEHFGIGRKKVRVGYWEFFSKNQIVDHLVDKRRLYPPEPDTNSPVERTQYLKAMAGGLIVAATLILSILGLLTSLAGYSLYSPAGIAFWVLVVYIFGEKIKKEGQIEIDEGFKGVFKILRTRYPVYSGEGIQFTFPSLFEMHSVNTKIKTIKFEGVAVPSQDHNQVVFDVRARFRVVFPLSFLGVDEPIKNLRNEFRSVLRDTAAANDLDFLTDNPIKVMRDVVKSFAGEDSIVEENWGLQLLGVQVIDITPSERMIKAREQKTIEEEMREAGEEKTGAFIRYFKAVKEGVEEAFEDPDITYEKLLKTVQILHDQGSLEVKTNDINLNGDLQGIPPLNEMFGGDQ